MAMHLGLLIAEQCQAEVCVVTLGREQQDDSPFDQLDSSQIGAIRTIDIQQLTKVATSSDLLVANPSFSHYLFGLSLSCKKLMYIQGFNTFTAIDGFFDYYVSVSQFVADFIYSTYRIKTNIIPAFVHLDYARIIPWNQRPNDKVLVLGKLYASELIQLLKKRFSLAYPESDIQFDRVQRISHRQLFDALSGYRYVVPLSPCEGFGLLPLEAMACKSLVVGFDGGGGRDFLKPGYNSLVSVYPDIDNVVEDLHEAIENPSWSEKLALNGAATAQEYKYQTFKTNWLEFIDKHIKPSFSARFIH